jgi:hypothetical protein
MDYINVQYPSGSWSQRFQENGTYEDVTGNFDLLAVQIAPPGTSFETPTYSNISDGSWTLCYEDTPTTPSIASASGTTTNYLQFDLKFAGPQSSPLSFNYVAYDEGNLRGGGTCTWDGSSWSCPPGSKSPSWAPNRSALVPEPSTMTLLGMAAGLGLLVRARRRR